MFIYFPSPTLFLSLTFSHHADGQTLHEAAGLAGLPSAFGDLTFIGGGAAVLDVSCGEACRGKEQKVFNDCQPKPNFCSNLARNIMYYIIPYIQFYHLHK